MDYTKISEKEILVWLKQNLDKERYEHSIATAQCAKELALKYGQDCDKAYITGLLHDCAKCFDKNKQLNIMKNFLHVSESEMIAPKTWHAPVSAYVAKNEFGVTDDEILSAIRWHTLGKVNMSVFEKIIFLADKIEPVTRTEDYAERTRKLLTQDNGLDKAILNCYKETIKSLVDRDLKISPMTVDIYNHMQDFINVN
ncbi:bis(5'-nucleosyl)-tetraphosphatase (symmetrical) YqeK [bacterium]|nr:bis(5'-nucleosyl)-tetraphosphatase (symmetrical) YqeK [bacterium]